MRTIPARPEFIPFLLHRMGTARVDVVRGLCDGQAEAHIAANITRSTLSWCGLDDDGVVNMGGVLPMPTAGHGYVWQFITDVSPCKRDYILQGRELMTRMLAQYVHLHTLIEPEHITAQRHLRRNGWSVGAVADYYGTPACLCERVR